MAAVERPIGVKIRSFLSIQTAPHNAQEKSLIVQINHLTDRGLPPTPQMIKNFVEEIIGASVGKNWAGEFVKRHKNLKSEYAPLFK